jgi:hypothetical protein
MVEDHINELSVGEPGLQVTVRCAGDVWPLVRAAFEAARQAKNNTSFPPIERNEGLFSGRSKADQIRDVARRVLADGRLHRRREISKAVRDAGLNPNPLTKVLEGCFERAENADGVFYRDPKAASKEPEEPGIDYPIHRIEDLIGQNGGAHG